MKFFLDTSVLLPVFYLEHVHHRASLDLFTRCERDFAGCGAHSLAELYSTVTRLPGKDRMSTSEGISVVRRVRGRLSTVTLTAEEYMAALEDFALRGLTGGNVYDALLAQCALKSGVETIYTWNTRHFVRCGPEVAMLLRTPEQV